MWFPSKLREVFGRVKGSSLGLSSSMSYQGHCHCFHGDVILSTGYIMMSLLFNQYLCHLCTSLVVANYTLYYLELECVYIPVSVIHIGV